MVKHLLPALLATVIVAGCGKDPLAGCTRDTASKTALAWLERAGRIDPELDAYQVRPARIYKNTADVTVVRGDDDWIVQMACGAGRWRVTEVID
jgi:hypothetical protein